MGVIAPEGFGIYSFSFQLAGRPSPYAVTIGFQAATSAIVSTALPAIVTGMSIGTSAPWGAPDLITGYSFTGATASYMTETGPVTFDAATSVTGSRSGSPLPPNCAVIVRKFTTRGGRKGRGRMFLPPFFVPETNVNGLGEMEIGYVTEATSMVNFLRGLMDTNSTPAVLLHSDGSTPDAITATTAQALLATQRRRLR